MTKTALLLYLALAQSASFAGAVTCNPGEAAQAFYAGSVAEGQCNPTMAQCWFFGTIAEGPSADGVFTMNWEDGDPENRQVHHSKVKKRETGEVCSLPEAGYEDEDYEEDPPWEPPEIPCTILPRLHWEGSDPKWNKEAIDALKAEWKPDEVIDGFDWHVILRFNEANRCEQCFNTIKAVLDKCEDVEKCYTHPYIKAIEYVGDDPETRRQTGRTVHVPEPEEGEAPAQGRQEL